METTKQSTLSPEFLSAEAIAQAAEGIDLKAFAVKFAIGYAYVVTGYIAAWNFAVVVALMTSIVWLQYVIAFALFALALVGIVVSVAPVSNAVYNAGATVARGVQGLFSKAKSFEMPSFKTVH